MLQGVWPRAIPVPSRWVSGFIALAANRVRYRSLDHALWVSTPISALLRVAAEVDVFFSLGGGDWPQAESDGHGVPSSRTAHWHSYLLPRHALVHSRHPACYDAKAFFVHAAPRALLADTSCTTCEALRLFANKNVDPGACRPADRYLIGTLSEGPPCAKYHLGTFRGPGC